MNEINDKLKNEFECSGCGACISICPKNAISKVQTKLGVWLPKINQDLCINCGICEKVCKNNLLIDDFDKKAYITYNKDLSMRLKSASGGIFSAIAIYFLKRGGRVFGAEMYFKNGSAIVEHTKVTQIEELPRLLGSKYVQSNAYKAYEEVRKELLLGNMVLFCGCSCQIAGLKNYLGNIDLKNLYTVDLVCHGVPSLQLFNNYITFLEKKYKGIVKNFSFRKKENGKITYKISVSIEKNNEKKEKISKSIEIPINKSGYYLAFMSQQSYRDACYRCPYASLDKPADLTIGDYFEAKRDYPNLFSGDEAIDDYGGISCVITQTFKGQELLNNIKNLIYFKNVSIEQVQKSHLNLQRPSKASFERNILIRGYEKFGYSFIDKYYFIRELSLKVPKKIKGLLKNDNYFLL